MSARIPPGFAEAWIQYNTTGDNEPMFTAIGIDLTTGVGATQSDGDAILAAFTSPLRPAIASDYTIGPGHIIFGNDGGDIRIDGSAAPLAGTGGTNGLPPNCAALVRKLTGAGGRRGRGRMYCPGLVEANVVSNGQMQSTYVTQWNSSWLNAQTAVIALPQVDNLVLFHETAPFTPTLIVSLICQSFIATQRRRLRP